MNMVARKYFLPILLGSALIFAIGDSEVYAANLIYNSTQNFEDDNFWGKFRDSVMKDRDKNKNEPSKGEAEGDQGENQGGDGREARE